MKKYDFIVLGVARTGTTSIFEMLSQHPEICPAKKKETISKYQSIPYELYLKTCFEKMNKSTKAFLDGTTGPYVNSNKQKFLAELKKQEWFDRLKIVYNIRNPFDRLVSTLKIIIRSLYWEDGRSFSWWFNNDLTIKKDALKVVSTTFLDSDNLDKAKMFTEYIHISKSFNFDIGTLLNFLEVEDINLNFNYLNKSDDRINKKLVQNIDSFINENRISLKKIFINDLQIIQDNFKVDLTDIILDVENI